MKGASSNPRIPTISRKFLIVNSPSTAYCLKRYLINAISTKVKNLNYSYNFSFVYVYFFYLISSFVGTNFKFSLNVLFLINFIDDLSMILLMNIF